MFAAPSTIGGDTLKAKDVQGHLLIVRALELREKVKTDFGESDAVAVNVADLDTGQTYRNALWFGVALVNGLKSQINGQPVLARMGQGTAKPGQSAPWTLIDATGDAAAVAKAEAWLGANPDFLNSSFSAPAPAAAPAAAQVIPDLNTLSPEILALLQKQQGAQV